MTAATLAGRAELSMAGRSNKSGGNDNNSNRKSSSKRSAATITTGRAPATTATVSAALTATVREATEVMVLVQTRCSKSECGDKQMVMPAHAGAASRNAATGKRKSRDNSYQWVGGAEVAATETGRAAAARTTETRNYHGTN